MANIKITALPANTGVQANSDVLPLVSNGVTTQVTPIALVNASLTAPGVIGSVAPNAGVFTQLSATVGPITVNNGSGTSSFIVNGISGQSRELAIKTANVSRWSIGAYNTESGSNTGSDYQIKRFDDSGAYVDAPVIINRQSGYITQNRTSISGALNVTGATTLASSLSGLLKSTSGLISIAISGTDYAPATTGTKILAGNGSGGFDQVTVGTGLTYSGGTLFYSGSSSSGTVTSVSVTSANGLSGTVATATTTPAITLSTTVTGVLKGNGTAISAAVAGTDYASPTSGSSILYGNGAGGFSNVTVGSGLSFSAGTLTSTSGGGSVTTVSVVSANGLAGTVANASSTPAITLTTSVTGLLKGNGTAISAATSGTDYAPATSGSSLLYGNSAGGFSNVTIGSNLTFSAGTLNANATVTSVGLSLPSIFTVTNSPVTSSGTLTGTLATQTANYVFAGPTTGAASAPAFRALVAGDIPALSYAPATSGTSILYGNGSGGFSNVTIGANLTFAAGTLSATGGGGMTYPGAGIPNSTGSAWGTSYGTSGVNSVVLRDASGNISTNSIFEGYSVLVASGTTTTLTASSFPNWYVTGSGGQTFQLPDATTLPDGATYTFNNNQSSGVITLNNNSGSSIISGGIGSGGYVTLVLQANVSAAGTWDYHFQTPANVSWTTNTFNYSGSFTGGTWNGSTITVNRGGTGATTLTGIVKGNGTSAFTDATAGTDYSAGTSALATGLLKSTTTTGALSIGVAGTDYVAPGGALGTPSSGTLTNCTGLPVSTGVSGLATGVATFLGNPTSSNFASAVTDETGTGSIVFNTSPTFVTPILGTPQSGTLTSCTGLPVSTGVSGLGTNVATFLATPSSANLASALTDETGSGLAVFNVNPTFTNYTETAYTANSSTAITLSLANGTMQYITLTGSPTITMPTAASGKSFTLILYTGSGSFTVSWATVAWAGGNTPTVTTTASKKDIFNFYSDGTNWYGSIFGQSF